MSSIKKKRLLVLREIDSLEDTHCKPCELTGDKKCSNCHIGLQLRKLGDQLGRGKSLATPVKAKEEKKLKKDLTKEAYLSIKNEGKTDKHIMLVFGLNSASLNKMKKDWGLAAERKPKWAKSDSEYKNLINQLKTEVKERDELIEGLKATIKRYESVPTADEETSKLHKRIQDMESACSDVEDELSGLKCKFATSERERAIAEDNLQQANRSLRDKEAEVKTLQHELSYARENVKRAKEIEMLFRNTLKVVL